MTKGLRQFLSAEQQRAWLDGEAEPADAAEREESLEQRFKYAARFEKLLRRPQAQIVLDILRTYGATCIPIPRTTERYYWSVSCLPSSPDKPLVRVNAGWMELFALHADGDDLRARVILHLSDFTHDASPEPDHLDHALLAQCAGRPEDVTHFLWKADTFGAKIRGAASIRAFLERCVERPEDADYSIWRNGKGILIAKVHGGASIRHFLAQPNALRAVRRFNLTHMNRGRNAYQASHCHSLADVMLGE